MSGKKKAKRAVSSILKKLEQGQEILKKGRYEEAKRFFENVHQEALAKSQPLTDREQVACLNNIGVTCKYLALFEEGLTYYKRALKILLKQRPRDWDLIATVYHNLGGIEHAQGRCSKAYPYAKQSVAARLKVHGKNHVSVALDRAAIAPILDELGKKRQAEAIYRDVIKVFARSKPKKNYLYEVAVNQLNLASLIQEKRPREALDVFHVAIKGLEKVLAVGHPEIGIAHNNIAMLYEKLGDFPRAEKHFAKAVKILKKALGEKHPTYVAVLENSQGCPGCEHC